MKNVFGAASLGSYLVLDLERMTRLNEFPRDFARLTANRPRNKCHHNVNPGAILSLAKFEQEILVPRLLDIRYLGCRHPFDINYSYLVEFVGGPIFLEEL